VLRSTVEVMLVQNVVQAIVKSVPWNWHDFVGSHPQSLLSLSFLPGSHRHTKLDARNILEVTGLGLLNDYYHGRLVS
jgi:hypothetical protein